ncbi:PKD domain-containing protein, partial [Flavobacteriaceae bacterium]|nr:PKD domain-containing protein [Flavobacteriaceae bacterium]
MIIKSLYKFFLGVLVFANSIGNNVDYDVFSINGAQNQENSTLQLVGSITGEAEVCIGETPAPEIIFTGVDTNNAGLPYTFEYAVNGGTSQFITTTNNSSTVGLFHPTTVAGTFVYDLISITDNNGDIGTVDPEEDQVTIIVNPNPNVSFTVNGSGSCSGSTLAFNSTVTGNGPFEYFWDFGDGNNSTQPNPSHVYNALGCGTSFFDVTLNVIDNNGCSSSFTLSVEVIEKPELSFDDLSGNFPFFQNCTGSNYLLTLGNSSPSNSCVTNYDIDWGDGSPIETNVSFPLNHNYTILGVFDITITASSLNGCNTTEVIEIANSTNPAAGVASPGNTINICAPSNPLDFAITNWHNNPTDTEYLINYGDGNLVTLTQIEMVNSPYFDPPVNYPITHIYEETNCPASPFTINIEVSTFCGTSILSAGPISLVSPPEVSFNSPEMECINTLVLFENTSINGFAQNCSLEALWRWNYGDGTIQNIPSNAPPNGSHTYTSSGTYIVSLEALNSVWNNCGSPTIFTREICIEPPVDPTFDLATTEVCGPITISPSNTTDESLACNGISYEWVIGYTAGYCGTT